MEPAKLSGYLDIWTVVLFQKCNSKRTRAPTTNEERVMQDHSYQNCNDKHNIKMNETTC